MSYAKDCNSTVIPALRYRDAHAAIEFLVGSFGFEKSAVYDGPDGKVAHAQLTFGNGMVMLGSVADDEYGKQLAQPQEIANRVTNVIYLVVEDAAALHEKAKAGGAVITQELKVMDYGGKAFAARDPEGHQWSFGEYDPWV